MVIGQIPLQIRDRSLDTMRGMGATKREGWGKSSLPLQERWGKKGSTHAEVGYNKFISSLIADA